MKKQEFDRIVDNGVRLFKQLLSENLKQIEDEKKACKHKHVKYIGDEWTGITWLSIYECKDCNTKLI